MLLLKSYGEKSKAVTEEILKISMFENSLEIMDGMGCEAHMLQNQTKSRFNV